MTENEQFHVSGFTPLDEGLGLSRGRHDDIVNVSYGNATDWDLHIEYRQEIGSLWLISQPIGYRVHDERELVTYWNQIHAEGAKAAAIHEIESSTYLSEIRSSGVSGMVETTMRHFLVSGQNTVAEIIASDPPIITNDLAAFRRRRKRRP